MKATLIKKLSYIFKYIISPYGWALFIILSAFFMRQVFEVMRNIGGRELISFIISAIFISGLILFFINFRDRITIRSAIYIFALIIVAGFFGMQLPLAEERTHIITYGILGFLWGQKRSVEGTGKEERESDGRANIIASIIFPSIIFPSINFFNIIFRGVLAGVIVSILDEGLQAVLPYRVGDMRDVYINTASSLWGSLLAVVIATYPNSQVKPMLNISIDKS